MNTYDQDRLTIVQRMVEVITIFPMIGLFGFFVYHQQVNSGFFTEKFGTLEALCLYVPILLGLFAPAVRAWTGHRNPARPFEIVTSLIMAFGSLVLLIVFPFSFAHLADTLPEGLRFILAWVTDDIGKIPLILQVIVGPITALVAAWRYFSYRSQTPRQAY